MPPLPRRRFTRTSRKVGRGRYTWKRTRWRGEKAAKVNKRLKKLRTKLAEKDIDGILITQADNRRYLSGFDGTAGYLIITAKDAILATDFRYTEQAKAEAPGFRIQHITGDLSKWLPGLLGDTGIKRLGFEGGDVTYDFHRQILDALKKKKCSVKLVPMRGLAEGIRSVKEPEEIEFIAKAAAITDNAFEYVEPKIKAGMTEIQVAWELEKAMRERGSQSLPFNVIVGPDAKFKKVYNTVLNAQKAAITGITRGMTGNKADSIAREVIKKAGYGEAFGHALGHGVGLAEHEQPRPGPGSKEKLAHGMGFTGG